MRRTVRRFSGGRIRIHAGKWRNRSSGKKIRMTYWRLVCNAPILTDPRNDPPRPSERTMASQDQIPLSVWGRSAGLVVLDSETGRISRSSAIGGTKAVGLLKPCLFGPPIAAYRDARASWWIQVRRNRCRLSDDNLRVEVRNHGSWIRLNISIGSVLSRHYYTQSLH